jgi:DNA-binding response OmpR family regulator
MSTRLRKDLNNLSVFDKIIIVDTDDNERKSSMVLITDTAKCRAQDVSDIFHYMGILSYAATPKEALSEISSIYKAVLILHPEKFADIEDYLQKLRSYDRAVPVIAITDAHLPEYVSELFDGCYPDSIYSSTLVYEIAKLQKERGLPIIGAYRLAGIDASSDRRSVCVFDKPLPFTKTEIMILKYLIVSYPSPQSPKNILKYAFKPSRKPEITSIRTHVSVMNKKFRGVKGKNLFLAVPSHGYVISTPEIIQTYGEAN